MRVTHVCLMLTLALPALAQYRGFYRGTPSAAGRSFGFGFGNVVFPGTGGPSRFSITSPGFAHRLGGIVTGFRPYTGAPAYGPSRPRTGGVLVPFAYPVFVGGFGYYPEYPPQQAPNVTIVNPPQQAPQIIINQTFTPEAAKPVTEQYVTPRERTVSVYQAPSPQAAQFSGVSSEPTIYLIAFKDNSVQAALAYWVEGDSLHYVTAQGKLNKASLELIDRDLSEQLNRERNVDFSLSLMK